MYKLFHLSDRDLLAGLDRLAAQDCATTALLVAHIAEVESRKLFLPAGYPSMHKYCVEKLGFSSGMAFKRIRVARMARRYPGIFEALADGRLNLSAILLLKPYLNGKNAAELLADATHKTRLEIERMLAERFPQSDVPTRVFPVIAPEARPLAEQLAPGPVVPSGTPVAVATETAIELPSGSLDSIVPVPAAAPSYPKITPLSPERVGFQATILTSTHDNLLYGQALLGHQVPSGDLAQVLDRLVALGIEQLEKQKFAATDKPRAGLPSMSRRTIPAEVKRQVWVRDQGQCTFVGDNDHRCGSRTRLEYDHVVAVAKGGQASVENIRLRCRAHNQYEAERTLGAKFMNEKRDAAQRKRASARARAAAMAARAVAADERAEAIELAKKQEALRVQRPGSAADGAHGVPAH